MKRPDGGSITPLTVLSVGLALLLIAAATTASSAFLAQRDLQAWCDGAVLATAAGVADARAYAPGAPAPPGTPVPLSDAEVAAELGEYLVGIQNEGVTVRLGVQNDQITLVCTHTAVLPFGRLFGIPDGIERVVTSSARVPWST